jgi:hypothetical protein
MATTATRRLKTLQSTFNRNPVSVLMRMDFANIERLEKTACCITTGGTLAADVIHEVEPGGGLRSGADQR